MEWVIRMITTNCNPAGSNVLLMSILAVLLFSALVILWFKDRPRISVKTNRYLNLSVLAVIVVFGTYVHFIDTLVNRSNWSVTYYNAHPEDAVGKAKYEGEYYIVTTKELDNMDIELYKISEDDFKSVKIPYLGEW